MTYETYIDHDSFVVATRITNPSDMLLNANPGIARAIKTYTGLVDARDMFEAKKEAERRIK